MKYSIKGWVKNSFCDWDGKISSVIFLPQCNMRCPFCQNWNLVENYHDFEDIEWQIIKDYLVENKDFVDGFVITGGEPFLSDFLFDIVREVKNIPISVKIDTNGTFPEKLKYLIENSLIDFVAMDVKSSFDTDAYSKATGIKITEDMLGRIIKSVETLMKSNIDYEFRTTIVPAIHSIEQIKNIANFLKGAKKYVLQQYRSTGVKDGFDGGKLTFEEMVDIKKEIESFFEQCIIRYYGKDA
jgi:pyruvate formate lyase activating enzyme